MEENLLSQSQNPELSPKNFLGIKILTVHHDEGGRTAELLRTDWKDILEDEIQQVYLSISKPGVIRAWHRHTRGQVDYLVVIKGEIELWIKPRWEDEKIILKLDCFEPKLVRVPGHYYHGTKNIGDKESWVLYFLNKLYDYDSPDEERVEYKE